MSEEGIEGDWTKYTTAIGADYSAGSTPWVGSYFGYAIGAGQEEEYAAIAPLDAGAENGPYVRDFGFENRIIPKALAIFATSKYPIAILRAFDHYATGENAMRAVIGEQGEDKQWYKKDDGTYSYTDFTWNNPSNTSTYGWNDTAPGVVTPEIVDQLTAEQGKEESSRIYIYNNLYKQYLPDDKQLYAKAALEYLSADEYAEAENIRVTVNKAFNNYFKKWYTGKANVEDDWDTFQDQLVNLGIERRTELLQKAWDAYVEATQLN